MLQDALEDLEDAEDGLEVEASLAEHPRPSSPLSSQPSTPGSVHVATVTALRKEQATPLDMHDHAQCVPDSKRTTRSATVSYHFERTSTDCSLLNASARRLARRAPHRLRHGTRPGGHPSQKRYARRVPRTVRRVVTRRQCLQLKMRMTLPLLLHFGQLAPVAQASRSPM